MHFNARLLDERKKKLEKSIITHIRSIRQVLSNMCCIIPLVFFYLFRSFVKRRIRMRMRMRMQGDCYFMLNPARSVSRYDNKLALSPVLHEDEWYLGSTIAIF